MRYLVFFSMIVIFSSQAMAQRVVLFEDDDWTVIDFELPRSDMCFARRLISHLPYGAAIFFVKKKNRAWSFQFSTQFDDVMPEGSALTASYTIGKTRPLKGVSLSMTNSGFFFTNFSRRTTFPKRIREATEITVEVSSTKGSHTFEFDLPRLPEMIKKVEDCVAAKRAQAKK